MCCVLVVSYCFQDSVSWKFVFLWVILEFVPLGCFLSLSFTLRSFQPVLLPILSLPFPLPQCLWWSSSWCPTGLWVLFTFHQPTSFLFFRLNNFHYLRYHWFFLLAQISLNPSSEFLISVVLFQLQNSSAFFLGFSTDVSILLRHRLLDFLWASLRWLLQRLSRRSVTRSFPGIVFFPLWKGHFVSTYTFHGSVSYNGHLNLLTLEIRFAPSPQLAVLFC